MADATAPTHGASSVFRMAEISCGRRFFAAFKAAWLRS
jgi:hypothetical protein